MDSPDLALASLLAAGGGHAWLRRLLTAIPEPMAAARATASTLASLGAPATAIDALRRPDAAVMQRTRLWLAACPTRRLLGWHDPDYPALLREGSNPPALLCLEGDASLLWWPQVAIVGTRAPTPLGRELASEFATSLATAGWVVTSGLAEGIDAAAHEAALLHGRTIAILGTGPDTAYPHFHASLQARIAESGLVVTEHLPGTPARRDHFPSRNRLLAALSLGTLVIEAAERSGALITGRLAGDCGREVFALPGSVRNPKARGCHRLIRDGAVLVERPQELLEALGQGAFRQFRGALQSPPPGPGGEGAHTTVQAHASRDPEAERIWQALGDAPCHLDELAHRLALTSADLAPILTAMELSGSVTRVPAGYARLSSAP